uniref:Uncharacterized protein n=1 Tax=Oryza sativa subsp. japonica TaxID=39947 RepID=Q9FWM2_ORYSJ|nr:hypothetical protein [Oryza sativa Japonica Group]
MAIGPAAMTGVGGARDVLTLVGETVAVTVVGAPKEMEVEVEVEVELC